MSVYKVVQLLYQIFSLPLNLETNMRQGESHHFSARIDLLQRIHQIAHDS